MSVNLRHLVAEVIGSSTLDSPSDIAAEVSARVHDADLREAFDSALRVFVRQVLSEQRTSSHFDFVPQSESVLIPSSKVAAVRDGWQRALRFHKVPTPDGWKPLGACTVADLTHAALAREEQGRRNFAKAKQYTDLAATLTAHDAATVGALPLAVLSVAIGQVAA